MVGVLAVPVGVLLFVLGLAMMGGRWTTAAAGARPGTEFPLDDDLTGIGPAPAAPYDPAGSYGGVGSYDGADPAGGYGPVDPRGSVAHDPVAPYGPVARYERPAPTVYAPDGTLRPPAAPRRAAPAHGGYGYPTAFPPATHADGGRPRDRAYGASAERQADGPSGDRIALPPVRSPERPYGRHAAPASAAGRGETGRGEPIALPPAGSANTPSTNAAR